MLADARSQPPSDPFALGYRRRTPTEIRTKERIFHQKQPVISVGDCLC